MCPLKLHIKIIVYNPDGTSTVVADNKDFDLSPELRKKILLYLEALNLGEVK
ncbi:MAG: hypothetical protein QIT35_gp38 [Methanophagales virus PBV299]|uniref:Uncharacterized protein n=1 Tax=Methanophagales virus PBV299 TaxID=2987730 RepID=A0ABY6GLF0_9CAUD|nr:MAG: hypothetical protein QIT35_gp38 [Methanophagales virus PBV299]UYL64834.1 MAG: hypothetical protein OFDIEDLO_00038 [Methanophagales virus PBV299]